MGAKTRCRLSLFLLHSWAPARAGLKALIMVGLYKLKALGTALIIKAIYGKLTPIGQNAYVKPWIGTMLATIVWDALIGAKMPAAVQQSELISDPAGRVQAGASCCKRKSVASGSTPRASNIRRSPFPGGLEKVEVIAAWQGGAFQ